MKKTGGSRKFRAAAMGKQKARARPHLTTEDTSSSLDEKIATFAQFLFNITSLFCTTICCIPVERCSEFNYRATSFPRRQIFIAVTSFFLLSAAHKYITFAHRFLSEPLNAVTCLCMMPCVTYTGYIIFCTLITFCTDEAIEMVRGWSEILSRFNFPGKKDMTAFSQKRSSMICIQVFLAASTTALAYPVVSCLLSSVPFFLIATAIRLGIASTDWMSQWIWTILLTPFEAISYAGPLAVLAFVLKVVYIEFGIEKRCVDTLRELSMSDRTYIKAAKLYTTLRLQNKTFATLLRPALTPALFCAGFLAVFGLYTVIRANDLPLISNFALLYGCIVLLFLVYFLSADAVAIIQASEDVIRNLQARDNPFFGRILVDERKMYLKRMRALRPLEFPVGHFGTLSFDVTQVVYEEILNQLLFLLSL